MSSFYRTAATALPGSLWPVEFLGYDAVFHLYADGLALGIVHC
jgi:hypothetical protein